MISSKKNNSEEMERDWRNEERTEILTVLKQDEYADLPPTQIVPKLAGQGTYIASKSTFYRVLREAKMQNHRGFSQKPTKRIQESHPAVSTNQVWTWDVTWLAGPFRRKQRKHSVSSEHSVQKDPYDDAVAEATYTSFKVEFVYQMTFESLEQLDLEHWD